MQERYPDDRVRIEPVSDAELIFPVGEEDEDEKFDPTAMATVRCPHRDAVTSVVGFDGMLCCRCPQCDAFIDARPPMM